MKKLRRNITHDSSLARLLRLRHPGSGWCGRCGRPWAAVGVEPHETMYNWKTLRDGRTGYRQNGCFPLCEDCWQLLGSPEARISYYRELLDAWEEMGCPMNEDEARDIQRAVANGG